MNIFTSIELFSKQRVLIIGEAILDSYLYGITKRFCREAPVPLVDVKETKNVAGGAANTAVNTAALGGQVTFLSVIGDDVEGEKVLAYLSKFDVQTAYVVKDATRQTLTKKRILADGQVLLRFDLGSTHAISKGQENLLIASLRMVYPSISALIISDYGYGILTKKIIQTIHYLQKISPKIISLDAKQVKQYAMLQPTLVKPNYDEALQLFKQEKYIPKRREFLITKRKDFFSITKSKIIAVTLDKEGAIILEKHKPSYQTHASPVENSKGIGAGDTYISAFTLSLAAKISSKNAADIASQAADIAVQKEGTAVCSLTELTAQIEKVQKKVDNMQLFLQKIENEKTTGKIIVFTNGCFDILHKGHIAYLHKAKALGDILVVGINTDKSIKRLKGNTRPINALEDRISVLSALSCIDYIVPFTENTPVTLIKKIKPHLYVKGGDYTKETIPEKPLLDFLGIDIKILEFVPQYSTTNIIKKIKKLPPSSYQEVAQI